ncbi:hypothetical protein I4U23_008962 [Adineta vaga]|nr:hypothetical protein I4U23_008962 [Adineta vaga]
MSCCTQTHKQQRSLDPSSYRVTVRQMSSCHLNEDSDKIYSEIFNQILDFNDQNDLNSINRVVPSIPLKKIVAINDGTQASSMSFITIDDEQQSVQSDIISDKSIEHLARHPPTCKKITVPKIQLMKSNHNELQNDTIKHTIMTNKSSPIRSPSIVDISEQVSSSKMSRSNVEQTTQIVPHSVFHTPILPISQPPIIDNIKSNEILAYSSQSIKPITSSINEKEKLTTNISKTSLGLHYTRSTLDFKLMFEDAFAQKLD